MNYIEAGLYNPGDGHVDPYLLTQALAVGARQHGATISQGTSISALRQTSSGGWIVQTDHGQRLEADRVVNAAGLWARDVGRLTGLDLPIVSVHHQVCTLQSFALMTLPSICDVTSSSSSSSYRHHHHQQQQQQQQQHLQLKSWS